MDNPQKCLAPLCLQHLALARGTLTTGSFARSLSRLARVPLGFGMSASGVPAGRTHPYLNVLDPLTRIRPGSFRVHWQRLD
jgi:hypothetical protein